MIHPFNILVAPLAMVVWTIDIYLFLVGIRLVTGRLSGQKAAQVCSWLRQFTDSMPNAVERRIAGRTTRPVPSWLPWLLVIVASMFVRQALAWVIVSTLSGHA